MMNHNKHFYTFPGIFVLLSCSLVSACGGSDSGDGSNTDPVSEEITVSGINPANGMFDPAPTVDGSYNLWMSFSIVEPSSVDPVLSHVNTRIASSTDGGLTWQDAVVAPNTTSDFQVPDGSGGTYNATWHYEVSRLFYDPYASDPNERWKILWHRFLGVDINGVYTPLFEHSWIGLSTAPAPGGPWSSERKLFVGTLYDTANDTTIGPPEFDLPALFPDNLELGLCAAFTEPGVLVKSDGVYISMLCGAGPAGKTVLLQCSHDLSSCDYLGDFLLNSEAAQFEYPDQDFEGFSASELFTINSTDYLMVTPNNPTTDVYRGCLVFQIQDLASAQLVRQNGNPVLIKRIDGELDTFRGACGYHEALTESGILLSQHTSAVPQFHIMATKIQIP
ncbi:MAG: hypothetical protein PVH98_05660 [Gammaproteobacteria bacterium]|jgi:hypothetical protein